MQTHKHTQLQSDQYSGEQLVHLSTVQLQNDALHLLTALTKKITPHQHTHPYAHTQAHAVPRVQPPLSLIPCCTDYQLLFTHKPFQFHCDATAAEWELNLVSDIPEWWNVQPSLFFFSVKTCFLLPFLESIKKTVCDGGSLKTCSLSQEKSF